MMFKRLMLALALACVFFAQPVKAQYPEKPITLIVPWPTGGSTDQTARVLAKAAEAYLGQTIVVVNRPGASTTIGMAEIAKSKPDGYTIGTLSSTSYLLKLQGRDLAFDPIEDFSYISYYGDNLIGTVVLADSPHKTLSELIAFGKANPGKLKYGTAGVGTTQHLTIEALQRDTNAKFVHVPQKGGAQSAPSLLGGHLDFIMETSVWAPFVESKQMRLLAVSTLKRTEVYPDVPTYAELGYKSLRSVQGIIAPKGLPEEIRAKLESAFRKALSDPAFQATMKKLAMQIVDMPGAEVKKVVESEFALAKSLIEGSKK